MLIHLVHFGCRLNIYESVALASGVQKFRFSITENIEDADFVIINTCTVTNRADQKNRQMIRKVHRQNPSAKIIVTGCYATTDAEEIQRLPGVYSVISNKEKANIPHYIKHGNQKKANTVDGQFGYQIQNKSRYSRAYLKIQDGCNKRCSYCKIPLARGPGRSRNFQETIDEAQKLISLGFKELTLTGVNIGWYQSQEGKNFNDLFRVILELPGNFYVRLSSIEPMDVNQELGEQLTHPKAASFLHVPLQSGSKQILKMMRRGYTPFHYEKNIEYVRDLCPSIHLGTDIIVGFPGETEYYFEETLNFCKKMKFANIHIFPFSKRNGTPITQVNIAENIPKPIVKERIQRLKELKKEMFAEYIQQTSGESFKAIVEKCGSKVGLGNELSVVTENYTKLTVKSPLQSYQKGDLLRISYDPYLIAKEVPLIAEA